MSDVQVAAARLDGRNHPKLEGVAGEADVALEAWARWAKQMLGSLGWPPWTLIAKVIEFGVYGAAARGGMSSQHDSDQFCECVEKIVMQLHHVDRRVIVMQYMHWQPIEVSSKLCGMSSGTFRTTLHRARREVGHRLEGIKIALQQNYL